MSPGAPETPPHTGRVLAPDATELTADRVIALDFPNTVSDTGNGEHP
jgi:hypothetical protein